MKFSATLVLATNVSDKSFFENISTKPSVKNICHQQHIGYIHVGDECHKPNVLVTSFKYWRKNSYNFSKRWAPKDVTKSLNYHT